MFLVTDLSERFPHASKIHDTKDVGDIVVGITGSTSTGRTAEVIAANMGFGDEFVCPGSFKLRCVPEDESVASTVIAERFGFGV